MWQRPHSSCLIQYLRQNFKLGRASIVNTVVELSSTTATNSQPTKKPLMGHFRLFQCLPTPCHDDDPPPIQFGSPWPCFLMTGYTMLGLARWAGKGGSYRTVQRLFSTVIPWAILFWVFFRQSAAFPARRA